MKNIHLEIQDELHLRVRQIQINLEMKGQKKNLKDLFAELIEKGATAMEQETQK